MRNFGVLFYIIVSLQVQLVEREFTLLHRKWLQYVRIDVFQHISTLDQFAEIMHNDDVFEFVHVLYLLYQSLFFLGELIHHQKHNVALSKYEFLYQILSQETVFEFDFVHLIFLFILPKILALIFYQFFYDRVFLQVTYLHKSTNNTGVSVPAVSRNTTAFYVSRFEGYNALNPIVLTEYPRGKFFLLSFEARKDFPRNSWTQQYLYCIDRRRQQLSY